MLTACIKKCLEDYQNILWWSLRAFLEKIISKAAWNLMWEVPFHKLGARMWKQNSHSTSTLSLFIPATMKSAGLLCAAMFSLQGKPKALKP